LQQADGCYLRAGKLVKDGAAFASQEFLMQLAEGKVDLSAIPKSTAANPRAKAPARKAAVAG